MKILVTGGMGYIGSHTVVELINEGYEPIILDNLSNSKEEVLNRIKLITNKEVKFYKADLCNIEEIDNIFSIEKDIKAVIHFAGLKAVAESVRVPLSYYHNNIVGTLNLAQTMNKYGVYNLIFSSSATVYGKVKTMPVREDEENLGSINPYGRTKLFIEEMLKDLQNSNPKFNIILLRYFNPIGAHESGLIGEDPQGIPNNLMPYITQVAVGKREILNIFGNDYNTPDGTCIRDYIHVVDLAKGHIASIKKLQENCGLQIYNLGMSKGVSVLEVVHAFEKANNLKLPYVITERRPGDVDELYADCSKALNELGWSAKKDIIDMCKDSWNWQKNNPKGYDK